ncbi:MAG: potassium-transporting ATPase subunit KdpC [Alphaproteobacteria bacterium]
MTALIRLMLSCTILLFCIGFITGGVYPAVVTGISQLIFPYQANGSVIEHEGKVIGSVLLGQDFSEDKYFWGRPSATVPPYNAASSRASNWSPNNPKLHEAVKERAIQLKKSNKDDSALIPVDLVTASASGLDPHISSAAAEYQIERVAKSRRLTEQQVRELVNSHTHEEFMGYGPPRVNVLMLNIALDGLHNEKKKK